METTPTTWRSGIDQYTIKFLIGFCRLVVANRPSWSVRGAITSITSRTGISKATGRATYSLAHYLRLQPLLSGYNGTSLKQLWLGKVAALALCSFRCSRAVGGRCARNRERRHGRVGGIMFRYRLVLWDSVRTGEDKIERRS